MFTFHFSLVTLQGFRTILQRFVFQLINRNEKSIPIKYIFYNIELT
nr:MAG TPA: hypothetical protein [Caudoviricetes sp.]